MTDARLAAIRARLAAAVDELPTPWSVGDHPDYGFQEGIWAADGEIVTMRDAGHDPMRDSIMVIDGAIIPLGPEKEWPVSDFLANAPADIAYLLERLAEAEAAAAELARLNQPPTIIQCGDPAGVAAFKLAEVTEQRDAARAKLAEAWHEGVDAALECRTQLENPYLLPGKDGPR